MSSQLLMQAAESGDTDVVESLLAENTDVNEPLSGGETALIRAASNGHVETVKILLAKGADVNAKPANGMTALIRAAFFGHAEVVAALLERGADTTAQDPLGQTALKWATAKGHIQIVKLLKNAPPVVAADFPAIAFTAPVPPPNLSPIPSLSPPVLNASSDEDEVTKISVRKIVLANDVAATERIKHDIAAPPPSPPMARSILFAPVAASTDPTDDYS
ncbi:MAG: ankyrin repeat domain-containing protein, partial [Acidobacteriota bacterium]|nr:ankyrin repeat domain-containing protein [Acidobacteriota bacterium]